MLMLLPSAFAATPEEDAAVEKDGAAAFKKAVPTPLSSERQKLVFKQYDFEFTAPAGSTLREMPNPGSPGMMYAFEGKPSSTGKGPLMTATILPDDNLSPDPQPELELVAVRNTLDTWKGAFTNYAETDLKISVGKETKNGKRFSGIMKDREFKGLAVSSKVQKAMWIFFIMGPASEFPKAEESFLQFLKTCVLTAGKTPEATVEGASEKQPAKTPDKN